MIKHPEQKQLREGRFILVSDSKGGVHQSREAMAAVGWSRKLKKHISVYQEVNRK